jgi:Mor family transcriptional regulator
MQRILKELSAAVGLPDAIAIVRRWGGRILYVPTTVRHQDAIALTLGLETARKLVDGFGGRELQLPQERNALLELRNASILAGLAAGRSHESLGVEFGLTRQMIGRISKTARERGSFAGAQQDRRSIESAVL